MTGEARARELVRLHQSPTVEDWRWLEGELVALGPPWRNGAGPRVQTELATRLPGRSGLGVPRQSVSRWFDGTRTAQPHLWRAAVEILDAERARVATPFAVGDRVCWPLCVESGVVESVTDAGYWVRWSEADLSLHVRGDGLVLQSTSP